MSGEAALITQLKSLVKHDVAQSVIFADVQAHVGGDGAEKTILNLSGESGILAAIKVRNNSTAHKIITIRITIDGGAEQSLTAASDLWTATPTADQSLHTIPIGARYLDSCVVKTTSDGGTGTAYSGCLYLRDQ